MKSAALVFVSVLCIYLQGCCWFTKPEPTRAPTVIYLTVATPSAEKSRTTQITHIRDDVLHDFYQLASHCQAEKDLPCRYGVVAIAARLVATAPQTDSGSFPSQQDRNVLAKDASILESNASRGFEKEKVIIEVVTMIKDKLVDNLPPIVRGVLSVVAKVMSPIDQGPLDEQFLVEISLESDPQLADEEAAQQTLIASLQKILATTTNPSTIESTNVLLAVAQSRLSAVVAERAARSAPSAPPANPAAPPGRSTPAPNPAHPGGPGARNDEPRTPHPAPERPAPAPTATPEPPHVAPAPSPPTPAERPSPAPAPTPAPERPFPLGPMGNHPEPREPGDHGPMAGPDHPGHTGNAMVAHSASPGSPASRQLTEPAPRLMSAPTRDETQMQGASCVRPVDQAQEWMVCLRDSFGNPIGIEIKP